MTSSATPTVIPAEGYAGDVTPQQAWQWVQEGKAVLVLDGEALTAAPL